MPDIRNITIEAVEVRGPYDKKDGSGSYERHVFVDQEQNEYFKFASVDSLPEFEAGQTIKVVVDTQTTNGRVSNKIIKGSLVKETKPTSKATRDVGSPKAKPIVKHTNPKNVTARDVSIARMNAVTSAISLLAINPGAQPSDVLLEEVIEIANKIITFTMAPYTETN